MSWQDDAMIEQEVREYWWEQGEAVTREMMREEDGEGLDKTPRV